MPEKILTTEPVQLVAGTSVTWTRQSAEYKPSEGFTLTYAFRANTAGGSFNVTASTSTAGDYWEATLAPATTTGKPAGVYYWQAVADGGTERVVLASGRLELKTDLATASAPYDGRSPNRKALDAIRAVLAGKASLDQQSYTIGDRSLTRYSPSELIQLESKFAKLCQNELIEERAQNGLPAFGSMKVRFRRS